MAIPDLIPNPVNRVPRSASHHGIVVLIALAVLQFAGRATATDWSVPEQQLAARIVALTGTGIFPVVIENRSSLGRRDSEIIQNGLRDALQTVGVRYGKADAANAAIEISLSENAEAYVWVAQIHGEDRDEQMAIVSIPRPAGALAARDSVPLSLRKTLLWSQADPMLDVAVLEEGAAATRIAVLSKEKLVLYHGAGGKWQEEQSLNISHAKPWPRDLRGRLMPAKDHLLDVYLPGTKCQTTGPSPVGMSCRESDDPWPLVAPGLGASQVSAFFATSRNFFTGAVIPAIGKFTMLPKFYSAAMLGREKSALWVVATTDGQIHLTDGAIDQVAAASWGSDVASVKTACGAGWQLLATNSGEASVDRVRAFEFPEFDPIAVTTAIDMPGPVTALWTEAKGDTAVAITRDSSTGNYEAYRLALACNQ